MPCGAAPVRSARRASSVHVRRSPAGPLRPGRARGLVARVARGREPNMWRYRELMPLFDGEEPVTLGEGWTPLIHAQRLGATLGLDRGCSSRTNRSTRPIRSRPAACRPRSRARSTSARRRLRCRPPATPATRWRPTPRRRASQAKVFMPRDVKQPFIRECGLYGADGDARRRPDHRRRPDRRRDAASRSAGTTCRR